MIYIYIMMIDSLDSPQININSSYLNSRVAWGAASNDPNLGS